jgi:ferredoxin--NADP+ reductase
MNVLGPLLGTKERPLRVAIVGAGPSGFYIADALFKSDINVTVDAFDRLPSPFGLLRGGVAPDHQQMKSVGNYYNRIREKNRSRFQFFGNVEVGKDISINELQEHYDAIVYTYGSESDKKTGLPGENLEGSYSAREFVGWYNGHPDYRNYKFDLSQETVAIIGQGNVAIDVARILAKTPQELHSSDITAHAAEALKKSNVRHIYIIGRRGPVQSAFTHLECKELGELIDCDIIVHKKDLILDTANTIELEENHKAQKNYDALQAHAAKPLQGKTKRIEICYFHSPKEIIGSTHVNGLKLDKIKLTGDAYHQKATPTGEEVTLKCNLLFRSIGYKGLPIAGIPNFDDKKGIIPNTDGRLELSDQSPCYGMYTSGWIKRGPSGVLGTNKPCATATIKTLLNDLTNNHITPCITPSSDAIKTLLKDRNIRYINYEEWSTIDAAEIKRGQKVGKPREKFISVEEMLHVLKQEVLN